MWATNFRSALFKFSWELSIQSWTIWPFFKLLISLVTANLVTRKLIRRSSILRSHAGLCARKFSLLQRHGNWTKRAQILLESQKVRFHEQGQRKYWLNKFAHMLYLAGAAGGFWQHIQERILIAHAVVLGKVLETNSAVRTSSIKLNVFMYMTLKMGEEVFPYMFGYYILWW